MLYLGASPSHLSHLSPEPPWRHHSIFSAGRNQRRSRKPRAAVPHRSLAASPARSLRGRAPPLASHLLGRISAPVQATTSPPPPQLSRQTCWLYVNMCVIVKFETYLAIKLLLYSCIWIYWHVYVNTRICYPTGTRVRVRILTRYVWRVRVYQI
jgi:hypothetical protein